VLQESANLFWNNTTNRLGIGTSSPAASLHVTGEIRVNAGQSITLDTSNNIYLLGAGNQFRIYSGGIAALNIATNGNTLIGTTTDAGYKLDVNGTMRVIGATTLGTTSASNITTVASSGSSNVLNVTNTAGTFVFGVDSAGGYAQSLTANRGMWFYNSSASAYIGAAASGCIAINTTSPNASAILDVTSTTKGVLFPRMTTTQKNAIASPASGLVVYDTTLGKLCVRGASAWETITSV
jgi:hypothetical protein